MPATIDQILEYTGATFGQQISSFGFPPRVVVSDSSAAISDPDDLIALFKGATNHGNIRPLINPGAPYLFLTHHWTSTGTAAASTVINQAPVVRVYGRIPVSDRASATPNGRDLPEDVDSSFGSTLSPFHSDITQALRGLWVPLTKPNYTKGSPELTLSGVGLRTPVSTTALYVVSEEEYVFTAGCDLIVVVPQTAATWTEGNASDVEAGVIVGRFGG